MTVLMVTLSGVSFRAKRKSLKVSQQEQDCEYHLLEQRLVESKQEVQQLKNRICSLEHGSQHVVDPVEVDDHESIKTGGIYASAAVLMLNHSSLPNQWVPRPPLFWKNIHVAGASVKDRLFVVGGAKGRQCSSEVEYLDIAYGSGSFLPNAKSNSIQQSAN
ncbi:putative development/cell death domain, kelch-type beta propeller containing protein [Tanacetum coccineum]